MHNLSPVPTATQPLHREEAMQPANQLTELVNDWERLARCKFASANIQKDDFGKRFIEHGATCIANCAADLKRALTASGLRSSATRKRKI